MELRAQFNVESDFGVSIPLIAYGHTEWDSDNVYVIVDQIVDLTAWRVKLPAGHDWQRAAQDALEVQAARQTESYHHEAAEAK